MTGKERRNLKRIAKRITIQSECPADNIREYYEIIAEAARLRFNEDNDITLDGFLMECFRKAEQIVLPYLEVDDETEIHTMDI